MPDEPRAAGGMMGPVYRREFLGGVVTGAAAWVLGYVFTYLIVAPGVGDSALGRVLDAVQNEPATLDMVGWVFYNAHLVLTVFADVPVLGTMSTSFIGGESGFTPLLYVVPAGLLLAAGLATGRYSGASSAGSGTLAGLAVMPAYFVLSALGALLFAVSVGEATIGPALLPAVALAGSAYPAICAAIGGGIAGATGD